MPTACRCTDGNGAGGFVSGGPGAGGAGARPQGLAIADFNHDGNLDIVVAHESSAGLVLFAGTASGGLTPRAIGGEPNLNVVAVAISTVTGGLMWQPLPLRESRRGLPRDRLDAAIRPYRSVGASPRGIVAADVNHDGNARSRHRESVRPDTVSLLLGNGVVSRIFRRTHGTSPLAAAAGRWWRLTSITTAASTSRPATRTPRPQACCGTNGIRSRRILVQAAVARHTFDQHGRLESGVARRLQRRRQTGILTEA